jgi:uncharacterized protein YjbI with pentapeptide repeats
MANEDVSGESLSSSEPDDIPKKSTLPSSRNNAQHRMNWIRLLIIPVVIASVGYVFTTYQQINQNATQVQIADQQHKAEQQNIYEQQQASTLQIYIDNMQDLLLNHNLLGNSPPPKNLVDVAKIQGVQELARARTLTVLSELEPKRKYIIVQFLYGAGLIGFLDVKGYLHNPIISLSDADLSGTEMSADLSGADLSRANLRYVNLTYANLQSADLSGADLYGADLRFANLTCGKLLPCVNLSGATLGRANLSGADLSGADLSSTINFTQQQLDEVLSCQNAILPGSLICDRT